MYLQLWWIIAEVMVQCALLQSRVNPHQLPVNSIVAPPGLSVVLGCSFPVEVNMDFGKLVINWQHGKTVVHSYYHRQDQPERQNYIYKGRTQLFHDQLQAGNASLMLSEIQTVHNGEYKCSVTSETGNYDQKLQLLVAAQYDEPEIAIQYFCKSVVVSLSSCNGFPEPAVTWSTTSMGDNVTTMTLDNRGRYRLQSNMTLHLTSPQTVEVEMRLEVLSQIFTKAVTLHPQSGERLPGDVGSWLAERVANPSPASFQDLIFCRKLIGSLPKVLVADGVWPADLEDSSQTGVEGPVPLSSRCSSAVGRLLLLYIFVP
ncbi:CD276 antigen-like isoform X2 [Xyrauchen texanus]|uniref:CD276 antigen-like isoform X2 n=1 Tax=Xyrauchen texanus TaxID=154827 RepID=UPI002242AE06|nr:CD276 antigen-like isoform X2 [Xyrauchen texanus]